MDATDGLIYQAAANPGTYTAEYDATDARTLQNNPMATVSHAADGGRSSAAQLIANKMQPMNPAAPVVNNQPIAGGDAGAQVQQPAAPANTGSYACGMMMLSVSIKGIFKWYALYKSTFYLLTYLLTYLL